MSMTIGDASDVVKILRFLNREEADPVEVALSMQRLRDRAGKVLQVSGPSVVSDDDIECIVVSIADEDSFEDEDEPYRPIEDVVTSL